MRGLVALNLRHLRDHPGRALLSATGIAAGSTIVVSMLGMFGSLTSGVDRLVSAAGVADLQVSSPGNAPVGDDVAAQIANLPGVATAAPVVRTFVVVGGHRVLLLGADDRTQALGSRATAECVRPTPAALSGDAAPVALGPALAGRVRSQGTRLALYNGTVAVDVQVAGTITCSGIKELNDGWFVAAPLPVAQSLAGHPGQSEAILVRAAARTSTADVAARVRAVVGPGVEVTSPRQLAQEARDEIAIFQQSTGLFVALALIVGGFLVFNTVSMTALERRRELATLRALGGRRRMVLTGVLAEAAVLGVVGATGGAVAGILAGRAAVASVPGVLVSAFGVRPTFTISPWAIAFGIAVGTCATILAALAPARAVSRVPPVDAMRPEGVLETRDTAGTRPLLFASGLIAMVAGYALSAFGTGQLVPVGFFLVTAGVIGSSVGVMGPLASSVAGVASIFGTTGRLAAAALERSPRRVWATTLAVLIGVGTVVAFRGISENQLDTFSRQIASLGAPDLVVSTAPSDQFPSEVVMPMSWVDRMARVPGVEAVRAGQAFYTTVFGRRVLLEGVQDRASAPIIAALPPADRADVIAGRAVSVTRPFASAHDLERGDSFELATAAGPQRVRVAGVVDVLLPVPGGGIGLALDDVQRWYGRPGAGWLEVYEHRGADRADVRRQVTAIAEGSSFPMWVSTGKEVLVASRRSLNQSGSIVLVMQWILVGATALAVLNTLLISVVERRRELGILRAIGTSRRRVRRVVATEAAAIGAVGATGGVLFGLLAQRIGVLATAQLLEFKVRYEFLFLPLFLAAVAAAGIVVLASLVPAWRAARVNVVEAIGYE